MTDDATPETPPKSDPHEGFTEEVWTYIGRRMTADKKLSFFYLDAVGEEKVFGKSLAGTVVGSQYRLWVKHTGDNVTVMRQDYRWVGMHPDTHKVNRWSVENQAAVTAADAIAAERKAGAKNRLLAMTLEDVGKEYRRLPVMRRRALLANIITLLTGGRTEDV